HGLTNLVAALPSWALEGGGARLRTLLRDPAIRRRLAQHKSLITSLALAGWDHVSLLSSARRPDLIGMSFADMARQRGTTPFDAVLDVLLDEADEPYAPLCISDSYTEEQLRHAYEHPACMVASEPTALCPYGPLAHSVFQRPYTRASWFFLRIVRD